MSHNYAVQRQEDLAFALSLTPSNFQGKFGIHNLLVNLILFLYLDIKFRFQGNPKRRLPILSFSICTLGLILQDGRRGHRLLQYRGLHQRPFRLGESCR